MNKVQGLSRWNSAIIVGVISTFLANGLVYLYEAIVNTFFSHPLEQFPSFGRSNSISTIWTTLFLAIMLYILGRVDIFRIDFIRRLLGREKSFDWEDVSRGAEYINERLRTTGYIPTHIIGIGRGGAIIGALISGNLIEKKHIPFTMFERKYNKNEIGMRSANLLSGVSLKDADLSRVLLVAGDVDTGITAKRFIEFLTQENAKEIRFAVFAQTINADKDRVDYAYEQFTSSKDVIFPWMLCSNYTRQDGEDKI